MCRRLTGIPYSFTAHAHDLYLDQSFLETLVRDADFAVAISEFNRDFMRAHLGCRGDTPLHVVHCGVDLDTYAFRPRVPPVTGGVRALCVASLQEYKGHRVLFEALARAGGALDRVEVDLVGSGKLRAELERQRRVAEDKERQLERYASDLRDTFKAERARTDELHASYVATVRALTNAVEARDAYTGKHAERVAAYGLALTRQIDPELARDPQVEFGFLLHDVGKVAISDGILFKPEPLLPEERTLMRRHAAIGYEIVCDIPFLTEASLIVRHHHERWDGTGYPDGLAGEEIPFAARIFAVVDAIDAMTTTRPYSPTISLAEARSEIESKSGTQFDPGVVAELRRLPDRELQQIKAAIA